MIVGADRGNADALWEAIQRLEPRQIIVAGAPGDSITWSAIERHARQHDIAITFLGRATAVALDTLTVEFHPPVDGTSVVAGSYVEIELSESRILVALGGLPRHGRYRVIVAEEAPGPNVWGDLRISTTSGPPDQVGRSILLGPGDRIDATLEPERIRISGRPARNLSGS